MQRRVSQTDRRCVTASCLMAMPRTYASAGAFRKALEERLIDCWRGCSGCLQLSTRSVRRAADRIPGEWRAWRSLACPEGCQRLPSAEDDYLLRRKPITNRHTQSFGTLHASNPSRQIGAQEPAISCFVRQSSHCREPQSDGGRCIMLLFE
jgi:hypothetical protein